MGEVYLAYDSQLRHQLAIKLLQAELTTNKVRLARFEREAYATSSLNHPNILTIYEIGEHNGSHFIATEYIEGESLRERMTRSGMELRETLAIVSQVADALSAAHEARIIHRDIKPENVMVRRDGYAKVLDFGLAKLAQETEAKAELDTEAPTRAAPVHTEPGMVMGTVHYMSPEQARGLDVDARSDIWSLGAMLYEMVAGKKPFEATTKTDVLSMILHREPPSLLLYQSALPPELERIVENALVKEREERYQNAKDLSLDLKRLKRRLELDAELERIITPGQEAQTTGAREAASTMSSKGIATNEAAGAAHTVSSAESVVSEIKRHKRAAVLVLATITLAVVAALIYYRYSSARSSAISSVAVLLFYESKW
jgi:serine/threonine protein kinase